MICTSILVSILDILDNIKSFLSFKNGVNGPTKVYFGEYYMTLVKINDFDRSIENKPLLGPPVKTNSKDMKNLSKRQEIIIIQKEIY